MKKIVVTYTLDELDTIVALVKEQMAHAHVFTFVGSLGAGKTTLIRALARRCGVTGTITSPTFTYVNIYHVDECTFYHFDLYRIATVHEFEQAGFDEYLYQPRSWSFIEWPEVIMPLVKKNRCHITLEYCGENARRMTLERDE